MSAWLVLALIVIVLCALAGLAWWWSGRTPSAAGDGPPRSGAARPTPDNPDPHDRTLGGGSTGS